MKPWLSIKGQWAAAASLFTRDKTWICDMIWLTGPMNRASKPVVADPVNPYTMRLFYIGRAGGAGGGGGEGV